MGQDGRGLGEEENSRVRQQQDAIASTQVSTLNVHSFNSYRMHAYA